MGCLVLEILAIEISAFLYKTIIIKNIQSNIMGLNGALNEVLTAPTNIYLKNSTAMSLTYLLTRTTFLLLT